jgi:V/A-type H+-transporting ATPase subunit I
MSAADDAIRALAQAGFAKVSFEQYSGVPSDIIAQLEQDLQSIQVRRTQIERDIDVLVEERPRAFALYDFFALERARLDVTNKFGGTERTFLVEGWVQLRNLQRFRTAIEQLADDIVVLDRPPREDEEPPVELENNRFASAFEPVTKMMGYPRQGSLDPSPFLGPFFLIFFGLCMTDAAYGIVIAALAYWLIGQTRARGTGRQFLNLLIMSGLATVFVGAMLGGWAGDLLQRLFGWRTAILFDPMEEPTKFLILSFALGVIQIYTGIILKAYDNIRQGDWKSAIFDQVFWLVFLTSIGLALGGGFLGPNGPAIASAGQKLLIGSAIGLVLTQGRHHKNPLMRIGSGLLSLYNTTGYMSDIVSYARLFGLGFTSTVLASVMNDLMLRPAGVPVIGPIIALIGLVFGHLFNILINIIGAYVHSSRLQYVEFFGKFFEAGGRRFMPFGMSTKYVDVENAKGA